MLRFADVVNAQQIMQWQWANDARQISRRSTIQIAHFPFPFFQRFATSSSRQCPRRETYAMSCHSNNEATGASEMPKFVVTPSQRGIAHERILTLPEADFEPL